MVKITVTSGFYRTEKLCAKVCSIHPAPTNSSRKKANVLQLAKRPENVPGFDMMGGSGRVIP